MIPAWIRILFTVLAGCWMVFWIVVCGKLMIDHIAELMGEDDEDKKKAD